MTSVTSMGIMLPVASSGAILMRGSSASWPSVRGLPPVWLQHRALRGLVVFTILVAKLPEE